MGKWRKGAHLSLNKKTPRTDWPCAECELRNHLYGSERCPQADVETIVIGIVATGGILT